MPDDKQFFDDESPLGGRPRRESLLDAMSWIDEEIATLRDHVKENKLDGARKAFKEIKGWVDALDDDLCERDENGLRKD